jgi:hypothetical protein
VDRPHHQTALHRHETAQTAVAAFQLLANEPVTNVINAGAVVALERAAQQPERRQLGNELTRKAMFRKGLGDDRQRLFVDKARHCFLDHALLVGKQGLDVKEIDGVWRLHGFSSVSRGISGKSQVARCQERVD